MPDDLVGVYPDAPTALRALEALHREDVNTAQVASPAALPFHTPDLNDRSSTLSWIALCGALTGLGAAMAVQVATSDSLGLVVGGKPIVSWMAFAVVIFELTMLFAGIANFVALVVLCAVARRWVPKTALEKVESGHIVVVVPGGQLTEGRRAAIRSALDTSAAEVR
jgi:hypothetical protein